MNLNAKQVSSIDEMKQAARKIDNVATKYDLKAEAEYKTMIKVLNALAIVDATEGADFDYFIDQMNSEIDHYKRILAQKKGGSSKDEDDPTPVEPENKDEGE